MRKGLTILAFALCLFTDIAQAQERPTPREAVIQQYETRWLASPLEKRRCANYARTLSNYRLFEFGSPTGTEIDNELRRVKCLDIYSYLFGQSVLPSGGATLDRSSVERVGSYLFVYINTFGDSVDDVVEKISSLGETDVQAVRTVVLDVRDNLGGYVNQVYKLLNVMFSPRDGVRSFHAARGNPTYGQDYKTDRTGIFAGREIRILTNKDTGSSSEWMLETLCYEWYPKKCVSVGTKTYGKAILQCIDTLKLGEDFYVVLKVTCGEWFLTNRRKQQDRLEPQKVQGVGIKPDKPLTFPDCSRFGYDCIARELADAGL
jgi:Peptidase family S41